MSTPRILAFSGSLRKDSFNTRLVHIAAEGARSAGADVTEIELRNFPMPIFGEDLEREQGMPEHARRLRQLMLDHQGLLISSPEYNSSITAALKNAIDWVSRSEEGKGSLTPYEGKVATLMSASPGALGGLRGLVHLRAILGNIKVIVLPEQVAISKAHELFDANGRLKDAAQHAAIEGLGKRLAAVVRAMSS